jgi:hypothetical protein
MSDYIDKANTVLNWRTTLTPQQQSILDKAEHYDLRTKRNFVLTIPDLIALISILLKVIDYAVIVIQHYRTIKGQPT